MIRKGDIPIKHSKLWSHPQKMSKITILIFFILINWYIFLRMGSEWKYLMRLFSGSCHLDRASNGVECQIFVIFIFFNYGQVLLFGAHSWYYKGALPQKRSFLMICIRSDFHVGWKNQNKHSTTNSSFDALSKWHEPDIIFTW